MLPYILLLFLSVVCLFFNSKKAIFVSVLFMVFFSIFRGDFIGTDTFNYIYRYNDLFLNSISVDSNSSRSFEFTTNFVYYVIDVFDFPPRFIIVFLTLITFIFAWLIGEKFKFDRSYFFLFFLICGFYIYSLNIARQIASTLVVGYAISFIFERGNKKYLFFAYILFAASLHLSSFLFSFFFLLRWIRFSKKQILLFLILFVPVFLFRIITLNDIFLKFVPIQYAETYELVLTQNLEVSTNAYIFRLFVFIIQLLIIYKSKNRYDVIFAVSIIVYSMSLGLHSFVARIFLGFNLFIIIYYSIYFSSQKKTYFNIMLLSLLLLLYSYTYIDSFITNEDISPYYFCFD